jgi:diguanylate cyclase (GGDEF)-like protein
MGKLAVPEYILNKPGKLTNTEFEKMKLHASVGADILSAIEFPYPVVPIVRHHHENWDGTGYPAGIKGTAIPIGARILAVIDCFDALTSDRPYRPRLSDEEALAILRERRGTMYDPMIVDTFFAVHATTPTELPRQGPPSEVLNTIARSRRAVPLVSASPSPENTAVGTDEMLTVYGLARALAGQMGLAEAGDVIAKHLSARIPSALCVFYVYDHSSDELEARHVVGSAGSAILGLRIGLGQRLSGWVAANRQLIVNSDAALDLGDISKSIGPRLRTCLSAPLVFQNELVGVLSLYSTEQNGFTDQHRRAIEITAPQIANVLKSAIECDGSSLQDALSGLPSLTQLEQLVDTGRAHQFEARASFTLLFIDVVDLRRINTTHGRSVGDDVLVHVVRHATASLRLADILFRNGGDEFVALLSDTNAESARVVGDRIRESLRSNPMIVRGHTFPIGVSVTAVSSPLDGQSLPVLIETARLKAQGAGLTQESPSAH